MKYLKLPLYIKIRAFIAHWRPRRFRPGGGAEFDMGILTSRGISPNVAQYFSRAPFSTVRNRHGKDHGANSRWSRVSTQKASFADDDFLSASGSVPLNISAKETCHSLQEDYPSAIITPTAKQ